MFSLFHSYECLFQVLDISQRNEFFSKTLPGMVSLTLQLPTLCTQVWNIFLWKIWWYVVKDILFQQVTMSPTKYFSFLCLCWLETDSTTVLEPYAVSIKTSTLRVTGSIRFLLRALVINHHHFPFNILFAGHSSFKTATKSQHNNEPRAGQNNFSWKDFEDICYRDWYFFS